MFYLKWYLTMPSVMPPPNSLCATIRHNGISIELYHEDNIWSGSEGNPDCWAKWNHPELLAHDPIGQERFELLSAIVRPGYSQFGLDDWK